ncbi:hypothetical protein M0R45_007914 [Rubus argutus]|uniref:Knottin scorpion toxin-like domain-containing protein n=1 Tax=Rubus argutus TaxID=59490 RepID=A0AAW1Y304_RUBAR
MAKSVGSTTLVLLVAFLLIASLAMPMVEGRGCKQPSKSFTGTCTAHPECDKKCKEVEKAKGGGLCRGKGPAGPKQCWCYMC